MPRVKKPNVQIVEMTPKLATSLLKKNTQNRNTNNVKIRKMVRDMKNGDFYLSSIAVGVDVNGVITDGGHRLKAVVKSGVTVPMILAKNLPPKARDVVDTGTPRSFANSLEMNDLCCTRDENGKISRVENFTKPIASASAYIILHQTNNFTKVDATGSELTNSEVVEFVRKNEFELMESMRFIKEQAKNVKYVQIPQLLFVYQMHKLFNEERAKEFVAIVCGKAMSDNPLTCPAVLLKDKLIEDKSKLRGRMTTKERIGNYVDASNKFMKEIEVKSLRSKAYKSDITNVKFVGELNDKATDFFNSVNHKLHATNPNK